MARYITRTVLHAIVVLLLVSFAVAFMLELTPGDTAASVLGPAATPEKIAEVNANLGLNDPFYERYWRYLKNTVQGDFGTSYVTKEPVSDQIAERFPVTLELALLALLMSLAVSIPIGVYTAYRAAGRVDRSWSVGSSILISFPVFVSAQVLIYLLVLQLGLFPVTGWTKLGDNVSDNLWHVFLPALVLALTEIPAYSRLLRADMIQTLQEDYVLAARAKGLPTRKILLRHALRPSSFSLLTLAGLSLGRLLGAAVIVEVVFGLPGVGQQIVNDISAKDVLAVQGVVMFVAIIYVVLNSLTDVAYHFLDPRVRVRKS